MNISCILWPFHGSVARCTFFPFPYPLINDSTVIHSPWCLSLITLLRRGSRFSGHRYETFTLSLFSFFFNIKLLRGFTITALYVLLVLIRGKKKIIDYFVLKSEKTNNLQRNQNIGVLRGEFKGSKVCTKIVTEISSLRFLQICPAYYIY